MNEQQALETKYIRSIQWSPLWPGEWQKSVRKHLKSKTIEGQAAEINWDLDKFITEMNKTELEQYDEFDAQVGQAIIENKKYGFSQWEVLTILEIDFLRQKSGDGLIIDYFGISYRGLLFLGAGLYQGTRTYDHVMLSKDDEYRTKLAACGYYYHTIEA